MRSAQFAQLRRVIVMINNCIEMIIFDAFHIMYSLFDVRCAQRGRALNTYARNEHTHIYSPL